MKRFVRLLVLLALLFSVSSCAQTLDAGANGDAANRTETTPEVGDKTLVVYFSWSGNTEEMATEIAQRLGADLLRLEPLEAYPEEYSATGDRAKTEMEENARPEIANLPESLVEYDTLLVGYPIWWHTAPMLIGTFLENYDLSGVDVYPFTQSASMDAGQFAQSMDFIRTCAVHANVHDGLFCRPEDTEQMLAYLRQNGLLAQ